MTSLQASNALHATAHAGAIFDIAGRGYVVTGAASGLGAAMAETLAANGAQVLLIDRNQALVAAMADAIRAAGGNARSAALDVTDADALQEALDAFARDAGPLDGMFANAGISGGAGFGTEAGRATGSIEAQTAAQWQRILDVNLIGTMNCVKASVPFMKPRRRGTIVVTASVAGLHSEPFVSYAYAASKAATVQLTRQSALELAPHGVRVNAIAPGFITTAIADGRLHDAAVADALTRRIPVGRLGTPREIQGLTLLLASDASAYMTGCVITLDGGVLLGAPAVVPLPEFTA